MGMGVYDITGDVVFPLIREECIDQRSYFDMLTEYVPKVRLNIPQIPRILNLGCGDCIEAEVLTNFFKNGEMVGIDLDKGAINIARDRYKVNAGTILRPKKVDSPKHKFIAGDARNLENLVEGQFDVIVSRNPDVGARSSGWTTAYRKAHAMLKDDGLFIGSVLCALEKDILMNMLHRTGYTVVLNALNKHAIQYGESVSRDRHVILAKK